MSKLRVAQVPKEFRNQMFANMVTIRGREGTLEACEKNITLSEAFPWLLTPEGHHFWQDISDGKTPKPVGVSAAGETLEQMVQEAERRGFANGVHTKWGQIKERFNNNSAIQEHELQDDGTFYYRNIKVRKANGKWIKPLSAAESDGGTEVDVDAIHAFLKKLVEKIHLN
jgi:hypothetical protein